MEESQYGDDEDDGSQLDEIGEGGDEHSDSVADLS